MGETTSSVLPTHLRAMRRSWLYLLVVALGVLAIFEGARTLPRMAEARMPGLYFNRRLEVNPPLTPQAVAQGIAVDDRIIAVDGSRPADAYALARSLAGRRVGDLTTVRIAGQSGERDVTLAIERPEMAQGIVRFAVGTLFVLFGIVVFWFHPGRREVWTFLFVCVAYGMALLLTYGNPRTTQTSLDATVGIAAIAIIGPLFVFLFAVFPRPLRIVVRRPRIAAAAVATTIAYGTAISVALAATKLMLRISTAVNLASLVACIAIVVWRSRRAASRADLTRARALILASVIAFLPIAVFAVLLAFRVWVPVNDVPGIVVNGATAAFPLLVGHAIVRRDIFDVERNVARAAGTSAALALVAAGFVGLALLVPRLLAPTGVLGTPTAGAVAALAATAALWPLKTRVQSWLVRSLAGGNADRLAELQEAVTHLATQPDDPARCGRFERRLEEACAVSSAALLLRDDSGWRRPATGERVEPKAWGELVELQRDDVVIGAFALGRAQSAPALVPETARMLETLAVEVVQMLKTVAAQGDRIGDYRIERFLAAGGMGNVYLATKIGAAGFTKPVAIKQLLPEMAMDPEAVPRFLKEARLVARLSHPGIVQTFELGETERGYFIAMEYIEGVDAATLARRLRKRRNLIPVPVACHIVTSACLALEHAHKATDDSGQPLRLIHHDVSPHNLMIDVDGNVKLADFGVAHVRQDPSREQLVGKIGYLAPEQLRRESLDHRVDVFAAGIVLYELVTGQHPFAADSDFLTMSAIEMGRFLPPETLRDECSPRLATVIERALATDPRRRFQSAAAFAEAIQQVHALDSRTTTELGALVRSVKAAAASPASSLAEPTKMTMPLGA